MKLSEIDFCLDWPISLKVINLREFIIANLTKKGEVIRWSIVDIRNSDNSKDSKKLFIHVVLGN